MAISTGFYDLKADIYYESERRAYEQRRAEEKMQALEQIARIQASQAAQKATPEPQFNPVLLLTGDDE